MLALFLNHPPLFVAGEIALGLSLVLFAVALIAAIIRGVPGISVARTWPSKSDDCSSVGGRSGARSSRCFVGGSGNDAVWFDLGRDPRCANKASSVKATPYPQRVISPRKLPD